MPRARLEPLSSCSVPEPQLSEVLLPLSPRAPEIRAAGLTPRLCGQDIAAAVQNYFQGCTVRNLLPRQRQLQTRLNEFLEGTTNEEKAGAVTRACHELGLSDQPEGDAQARFDEIFSVYQRVAKQIWSELSNDLEPAGRAQSRASATTHLVGMVEWSRAQGDDTVTLSASAAAYEAELFMRVAEECFAARAQMHQPEPESEPEPEPEPEPSPKSWFAWLW